MSRRLPSTHADTHRPPGTLGPTDPGGSDPIPADFGVGLGGIRFDTYPQAGDWLYVETTGGGGPNGAGFDFESVGGFLQQDTSSYGVTLNEYGSGGIGLWDYGGGGLLVTEEDSSGNIELRINDASNSDGITLFDNGTGGIDLNTKGEISLGSQDGFVANDTSGVGMSMTEFGASAITFQTQGDLSGVNELYLGGTTGPDVLLGNADAQFVISQLAVVTVTGQAPDDASVINVGIRLDPGVGNAHPWNAAVYIPTTFGIATVTTEPVAPNTDDSVYLYHYDAGAGTTRLKAYFPKTGTRTVLASS